MRRLSETEAAELLRRYKIHTPVSDERYLAHADLDRGYQAAIAIGPHHGESSTIALVHGDYRIERLVPLSEFEAAAMVEQLRTAGMVPLGESVSAMLANVLVQAAKLYEQESLAALALDPIFIRTNDYRVANVTIDARKKTAVKKRLAGAAHDAGAVFPYRPTARGR